MTIVEKAPLAEGPTRREQYASIRWDLSRIIHKESTAGPSALQANKVVGSSLKVAV